MKKSIIKTALGLAAITSLFMACGEAETMFNQILWSGSWMAICYLSGKALKNYMDKEELEEIA